MDISIIIVNYNVREFLQQALRSVERSTGALLSEIFVVDNNSVDGSLAMLQRDFPQVRVIANDANLGFAKANNQAIAQARGRYLLILNPDTIVQEDTIGTMVDFMEAHPDAGALGCQILNPDGTFAPESRRAFPTPPVAFFRMTGLSRLFPGSRFFGRYNVSYLPIDSVAEIDALSGSCMMVRRAALCYSKQEYDALCPDGPTREQLCATADIALGTGGGLLDESFFMYGEDLDWCFRIQQAGWKILYTPDTRIIHYKGESTKKSELAYVRLFYGAMLRFAEKHLREDYPRPLLWMMRAAVVARGSGAALGNALRHLVWRDLALAFLVVTGLGLFRSAQIGIDFPGLFYWLIAPGFSLLTAGTIAALGGYRGHRKRLGPVWIGVSAAVVMLAASSFFFKQIAFSRAVVLASLPAGILVLSALRLARPMRRNGRALFVGDAKEALRMERALHSGNAPTFDFMGYITPEASAEHDAALRMPRLGSLQHLRGLVQVRGVQDVIFASASLSNKAIFTLMQRLRGLPVQTRILAEDRAHVIGKASIDHLPQATLVKAEDALGALRNPKSRRLFDAAAALAGAIAHPFLRMAARLRGKHSFWAVLAERTSRWPDVLWGRRPLVGYREDEGFIPPAEWQLRPGVFAVTDSLGPREDAEQAYWYYVRNQSAILDWIIILRAVRMMA